MQGSNFDLPGHEWAALRRLLGEALDLPTAERGAWLDRLDPQWARLKPRLLALLAHAESPAIDGLLDMPPLVETDEFAPAPGPKDDQAPPDRMQIGPYRLLRQIGEGGMAAVWLAERMDMLQSRKVALKLPHGAWRRVGLAERMAREREILATLEHPNIARLYDAGLADDGQPYLALEYVEGQRIDAYCRERALDVRDRLRLFMQVTDAVAHAHAHLIVHRDLKPSNVLVTAQGQVRLLDFGIAKLMAGESAGASELTQEGSRAFTPEYASPEQMAGRPLGIATDVYSLGVMLHELLTGRRPYADKRGSPTALEHAHLHKEPAPPSAVVADPILRKALRGDLDTLLLKALKQLPGERYATVNALADDMGRHLRGLPLLACPDSLWYRLRKFVHRNRLPVAAGSAAGLAVVFAAGAALWQASEARLQRDAALHAKERADREAASARMAERVAEAQADLSSFVLSDYAAKHADEEMVEQLEHALVMVRAQYRDDPALRGRLLLGIGEQFRWISEHARADTVFAEAQPLLEKADAMGALSRLLCIRASAQARTGHPDAALALIVRASRINPSQTAEQIGARAECLMEEALVMRYAGDPGRAIPLIEQALTLEQRIGRAEREDSSEAMNALARAQLEVGRFADAASSSRRSIALLERIGRARTPGLLNAWGILAIALRDGGRPLDAERAHRANGAIDPVSDAVPLPLRVQYAFTLRELGRHAQALPLLDKLAQESLAQGAPSTARYILLDAVAGYAEIGRIDLARARLKQAAPLFEAARAKHLPQARSIAIAEAELAMAEGRPGAAIAAIEEARDALERTPGAPHSAWRPLWRLDAQVALSRGQAQVALELADKAVALSKSNALDAEGSLNLAKDLLLRADARKALGDSEGARTDARLAERHASASAGPDHPLARRARDLAGA